MPDAPRTRGLVCSEESTRVRNRGYAEHSGIPCAMVYSLWRDLPGVRALIATVVERGVSDRRADIAISRNLTSASGGRDHTLLPSESRITRQLMQPSSIASRANVRDDRATPLLVGRDVRREP